MSNSDTNNQNVSSRKNSVIVLMTLFSIFSTVLVRQLLSSDHGLFLEVAFAFVVLCADLIYVLFLFTRRLRRPFRIGLTSFVIAFLFAPGALAGDGVLFGPAWMFLFIPKDQQWFHVGVTSIGYLFLIVFCIQYVSSIFWNLKIWLTSHRTE